MSLGDYWQVALDGPAGAGKSTIARTVAEKLHLTYLDTGAMYRATAWFLKKEQIRLEDEAAIEAALAKMELRFAQNGKQIFCNGEDISEVIRLPEISAMVSSVAAIPLVRANMASRQRETAKSCDVIMDGRDIGTAVLPNAQVKIFLTASLEERAQRRYEELQRRGVVVEFDTLKKEIALRDQKDATRAVSPLKKAQDAVELDTSGMIIDDVIKNVLSIISNKGFHIEKNSI